MILLLVRRARTAQVTQQRERPVTQAQFQPQAEAITTAQALRPAVAIGLRESPRVGLRIGAPTWTYTYTNNSPTDRSSTNLRSFTPTFIGLQLPAVRGVRPPGTRIFPGLQVRRRITMVSRVALSIL